MSVRSKSGQTYKSYSEKNVSHKKQQKSYAIRSSAKKSSVTKKK